MRRRLVPQVLELLGRGVATEYLVAVRVAPKARYNVASCPCLADEEFSPRSQVGRSVGSFLFSVLDATFLEGEVLRVAEGEPEKVLLHRRKFAVHPKVDAFEG